MKIPNCKGSVSKRNDCEKWIIKYPLGWNAEKNVYDYYQESLPSQPDAILALKDINEFIYFGGAKTKKSITIMRKNKQIEELQGKEEALISFTEFATDYTNLRYEQNQISNRTYEAYLIVIKRIDPYIGHLPLVSIKTKDIDEMYRLMKNPTLNKNPKGKPHSGTTIQKTHAVLSIIFNHAVDYQLIDINPAQKAQKPKNDTKEKEVLTLTQVQNLYARIISTELTSFSIGLLIGLLTGVRLSEMLALTWKDYSKQTLHIHASLERDSQVLKDTKTGEERYISCPSILVDALNKWQAQQKKYFNNTLHLTWSKSAPIVNSRWGTFKTQSNYRRWLTNHRKDYDLPDNFHYHELRHTYVTLLYRDCGVDEKTTRELSGHKSIAFQRYTHTDDEWRRKATNKLNDIIITKNN